MNLNRDVIPDFVLRDLPSGIKGLGKTLTS